MTHFREKPTSFSSEITWFSSFVSYPSSARLCKCFSPRAPPSSFSANTCLQTSRSGLTPFKSTMTRSEITNETTITSESEENSSTRSGSNSSRTGSSGRVNKKRKEPPQPAETDLTTVEGQLKKNPNLTEEQAKSQARREYNRLNAQRARKKNKELVQVLQNKVESLSQLANKLKHENEVLKAQLEITEKQNAALMGAASSSAISGPAVLPHQIFVPPQVHQQQPQHMPTNFDQLGLLRDLLSSALNNSQQAQQQPPQAPPQQQQQSYQPQDLSSSAASGASANASNNMNNQLLLLQGLLGLQGPMNSEKQQKSG